MDNDEEDLLDDDTWLAQQLEHNWPAAMPEPSVVDPDEACSRKLSVMEALECILNASTDAELDAIVALEGMRPTRRHALVDHRHHRRLRCGPGRGRAARRRLNLLGAVRGDETTSSSRPPT